VPFMLRVFFTSSCTHAFIASGTFLGTSPPPAAAISLDTCAYSM